MQDIPRLEMPLHTLIIEIHSCSPIQVSVVQDIPRLELPLHTLIELLVFIASYVPLCRTSRDWRCRCTR